MRPSDTLAVSWSEPELLDLMVRYPQIAIIAIRITGKRCASLPPSGWSDALLIHPTDKSGRQSRYQACDIDPVGIAPHP